MNSLTSFALAAIFCTIFSLVDSSDDNGPMLLSQKTVGKQDSFTVYCNRSSFSGVKFPDNVQHIEFLAVCRALKPRNIFPVAFYSLELPNGINTYTNATEMGWKFSYSGGERRDNVDTIQLNMTFTKASCNDAGAYLCWAQMPSFGILYSSMSYLLPRPPRYPGDQQGCIGKGLLTPIISKNVIGPGDNFTVTCDLSKFHDVYLPTDDVTRMDIYRQDMFEKKRSLFPYYPINSGHNIDMSLISPEGRNWTFSTSGERENASVVLTVHDAQFQDAGTYMCLVTVKTSTGMVTEYSNPDYLYALDVHYGPQVVNKYDVGPRDQFTVTCDVTKFIDKDIPKDKDIVSLRMARKYEDEPDINLAQFESRTNTFSTITVPPGRKWNFNYSRGLELKGNRNKLRLTMDVLDANCNDAGAYYCIIEFVGSPLLIYSTRQLLQPRAPRHQLDSDACIPSNDANRQPFQIIDQDVIGKNEDFEMKCDASSFRNRVLPSSDSYEKIGMVRRLPTDKVDRLIALLWPKAPASNNRLVTLIPPGRKWTFRHFNGPSQANKEEIRLIMNVPDAGCQDAGIYKCIVKIESVDRFFYSWPHTLYPRGPLYPNEPHSCPYTQWRLISDLLMGQDNFTSIYQ